MASVWDIEQVKHDDTWKLFAFRRYAPPCRTACAKGDGCDAGFREAMHIVEGNVSAPDRLAVPVRTI